MLRKPRRSRSVPVATPSMVNKLCRAAFVPAGHFSQLFSSRSAFSDYCHSRGWASAVLDNAALPHFGLNFSAAAPLWADSLPGVPVRLAVGRKATLATARAALAGTCG